MLTLRRASEDDLPDIAAADRECLPYDEPAELDGVAWWVIEVAGSLIAYAGARRSVTAPGTAYLCRAGVLPDWRGHGLQRRLIRARERWARAAGLTRAVTDTLHNPASANSLIRCGYRMWEPEFPWAGPSACYWVRRLIP